MFENVEDYLAWIAKKVDEAVANGTPARRVYRPKWRAHEGFAKVRIEGSGFEVFESDWTAAGGVIL